MKKKTKERLTPHHCHAIGCATPVPPEMLMCFQHWRRVPKVLQAAVWKAYRPGQCDDWSLVTKEWHAAANAAIQAVAKKEGRI